MFSQLTNVSRLLVLLSLVLFVISGSDRVRAADVTITPSDLTPTEADPDATPAVEAKSAQQKVMEKIASAGPGDTVTFPGGSYKDVGEILIAKGGEPSDDPETGTDEGDGPIVFQGTGTIFTGKIMFNVKAAYVVIRGFTFMNTAVPDAVTVKADDPDVTGDQAIRYGFPGATVESFLKDDDRVGSGYTDGASPPVANIEPDGDAANLANNAELWVTVAGADTDIANKATGAIVTDAGTNDFRIWEQGITSAKAKDSFGTVWVDSIISGPVAECRVSGAADVQVAGVVVRNNMFSMTETAGVRAGDNPLMGVVAGARRCASQVDVIGNTFMNIGGNGPFVENSRKRALMDSNGNMIADIGNREPAIDIRGARAAMITDNTLGGSAGDDGTVVPPGTSDAIVVREAPMKAAISVSNNRITSPMLNGILISDSAAVESAANAASITVSGNVISGVNANRYLTAPFTSTAIPTTGPVVESYESERDTKCNDGGGPTATTAEKNASNLVLAPEVWRSRVDDFPFLSAGAPRALAGTGGVIEADVAANIGNTDLVRYKAEECFSLGSVKVVSQEGVSLTNNDLGYTADGESSLSGSLDYGVVVEGASTELAAFRGNNVAYSLRGRAVRKAEGPALSVAGNYLGESPVLGRQVTGTPESDPIEPTTEAPRVVGPREDFINPDEVAPTAPAAAVNEAGTMLTLTYGEDLDEDSTPSAGAFTVRKSSDEDFARSLRITVSNVRVVGRTVILTLASSPKIEAGDTVRVTYVMPSGAADKIQDMAENPAPSFATSPTVTNNVGGGDGGDTMTPPAAAGGGGGGCALASAGSEGTGLGMLPLLLVIPFAFALRRKTGEGRSV